MTAPPASFAFTKLVVDDLDAAAQFYEQVCGMKRMQRVQAEIDGEPIDEIILGTDAGVALILLKWLHRASVPGAEVIVGFTTSDIGVLFERAVAAGGRVRQPPAPSEAAGGMVVGFLEDPEGHLLEVVEQP